MQNWRQRKNGNFSQNFITVYKIGTRTHQNWSELAKSNKESYSKVASLRANCQRLSFGPGVYLRLSKQESEAKTSREVRPDPDIKSIRVCKYILARVLRIHLGGRRSDRDEKGRARASVGEGGGDRYCPQIQRVCTRNRKRSSDKPPDNRRGGASDDLPVIGVPCNRQVCRWLNLQHHRGSPKGPVKGCSQRLDLDTRSLTPWFRGSRRLPGYLGS